MKLFLSISCMVGMLFSILQTQAADKSDFRIVGYFASWNNVQKMAKSFDYSKVTHLNYCFTNVSDSLGSLDDMGANLDTLVRYAHAGDVKVLISLGGGTMSAKQIADYKYQIKNEFNRARFISSIIKCLERHQLDGFDVDIEGDRITANYGAFIRQLTDSLQPKGYLVTAALGDWGGNNVPNDVVPLFDFITIMSYDAAGSWDMNNVAQHSSFELAQKGLTKWESKGALRKNLVVGLPFYGYAFNDLSSMGFAYYKNIISRYPHAYDQDTVGAIILYNGISTIKQKTNLALDSAGGVMIWELAYDTNDEYSLLKAVNEAVADYDADDLPPVVSFVRPANDTVIEGREFSFTVSATDADGVFRKIRMYVNGVFVDESIDSTAHFTLTNLDAGNYIIVAEASDHQFRTGTDTLKLRVHSAAPAVPFGNEPILIPGKIEAENFDVGGKGVSYHDATAGNAGKVYRATDVDVESCFDAGGGFNVGSTSAGEWIAYTVEVAKSGTYAVEFRTAAVSAGKSVSLFVDGKPVISNFAINKSGGMQVWNSTIYKGIELSQGTHVLRLQTHSFGLNINYILLYPSVSSADTRAEMPSLQLFPNPAHKSLFIKSAQLTGGDILVRNLNGQIVLEDAYLSVFSSFHELNISALPSGLYMLEVSSAGTVQSGSFVKQ